VAAETGGDHKNSNHQPTHWDGFLNLSPLGHVYSHMASILRTPTPPCNHPHGARAGRDWLVLFHPFSDPRQKGFWRGVGHRTIAEWDVGGSSPELPLLPKLGKMLGVENGVLFFGWQKVNSLSRFSLDYSFRTSTSAPFLAKSPFPTPWFYDRQHIKR
jgi:hypothetical protein